MTVAQREQSALALQGQSGQQTAQASGSGSGANSDVLTAINKLSDLGIAVKALAEKVSTPTMPAGGSQDSGLANVKTLWSRPPSVTGENPEKEDVRAWLRLVGRMVEPLTNSSQGKADFVAGCLRGNAQSLYETRLEQQKPSFEELSDFLVKEFAEKNPEHHARLRLKHLRMKEGNLPAFKAEFNRNLSLCEKKPIHDADAIEFFYDGLTPELQNLLLMDPLTKEWWANLTTLMDAATLMYSQRGIKAKQCRQALWLPCTVLTVVLQSFRMRSQRAALLLYGATLLGALLRAVLLRLPSRRASALAAARSAPTLTLLQAWPKLPRHLPRRRPSPATCVADPTLPSNAPTNTPTARQS